MSNYRAITISSALSKLFEGRGGTWNFPYGKLARSIVRSDGEILF